MQYLTYFSTSESKLQALSPTDNLRNFPNLMANLIDGFTGSPGSVMQGNFTVHWMVAGPISDVS